MLQGFNRLLRLTLIQVRRSENQIAESKARAQGYSALRRLDSYLKRASKGMSNGDCIMGVGVASHLAERL